MPRTRDEGAVAKAAALYASGKTSRAIAAELGRDPRTIERWLGEVTRRRGPRGRTDVPDRLILEMRDEWKLSFDRIAAQTGMSRTGVRMRYLAATGQKRPDRTLRVRRRCGGGSARRSSGSPSAPWRHGRPC